MKRSLIRLLLILSIAVLFSTTHISVAQDGGDDDPIEYAQLVSDNGLSMFFPSDWIFEVLDEGSSAIVFYSNEAIAERDSDAPFESGDISLFVSFFPTEYASLFGFRGETHAEQLTGIIDAFAVRHTEDGVEQFSTSEIEVIDATDDIPEITLVRYSLADTADGMLILWNITADISGSMIVSTATDEVADYEALIMDIVGNITFDETQEGETN